MDRSPDDLRTPPLWVAYPVLAPLKDWLLSKWTQEERHAFDYHRGDTCLAGSRKAAMHGGYRTAAEQRACFLGTFERRALNRMTSEVAQAIRYVAVMQEADRVRFWHAAKSAFVKQQHDLHRALTGDLLQELVDRGFKEPDAKKIIDTATPRCAIEAVEWAYAAQRRYSNLDALNIILRSPDIHQLGVDRLDAALATLGLPGVNRPSLNGLVEVLKAAYVALQAGLPRRRRG